MERSIVEEVLLWLMAMELFKLAMGRLEDRPMSGLDTGVFMVSDSVRKFKGLSAGMTGQTAVEFMVREDLWMVLIMLMEQGVLLGMMETVLVDTLTLVGFRTAKTF